MYIDMWHKFKWKKDIIHFKLKINVAKFETSLI